MSESNINFHGKNNNFKKTITKKIAIIKIDILDLNE